MKTSIICLLVISAAAVATARPTPTEPAAVIVQRQLREEQALIDHFNPQLGTLQGFSPLPMPAIHLPESGTEFTFPELDTLKTAGLLPTAANMQPLTLSDVHWPDLKLKLNELKLASREPASTFQSTSDNKQGNSQEEQRTPDNTPAENTQQKQQPEGTQPQQPQQPPARDAQDCSKTDTSADAVFRCVNAVRTNPQAFKSAYPCSTPWLSTISRSGRSPLNYNQKLTNSAQRQANDMARNARIDHVGSDGSTVGQRIKAAGYTTFPQAENIAMGQNSAYQVTMEWMCSEGHRKAIMNCEYDDVGTAVAESRGTWYYAQNFGCSTGRCPICDLA